MSADDITEIKNMLNRIIAALYGKAGELNGAGIGLVARVDSHNDRLNVLELVNKTAGSRAWELVKLVLAPLVAAFIAAYTAIRVAK